MVVSFFYIILALLGLSFLIFIHELGHYWMARRVGMRVETFAIGFGKPIYKWVRDGVNWQIGWLFFGGYVKIAGQEVEEGKDPYHIPDGFFGKSPWDRIKVAFAGPFMNLIFAFLLFIVLWGLGGREKNYSEFSAKIGWIDTKSELYQKGVRPGDEIVAYEDNEYNSSKDHFFYPMIASDDIELTINKIDYLHGKEDQEAVTVNVYPHPAAIESGIKTAGIIQPASYIIYDKLPNQSDNPLPEGSPLADSGIKLGDRIVWVDGEVIFSLAHLNDLLNDDKVLATIERDGKKILRRIPRVKTQELRLDPQYREELIDWQYEAHLNNIKFRNLYTIPYDITNKGVVESRISFIDKDNEEEAFPQYPFSELETPLMPGDRIIAINGTLIDYSSKLLQFLQERRVNIIVDRGGKYLEPITARDSDRDFDQQVNWSNLEKIANSIGTGDTVNHLGNLYLLETVTPKKFADFPLSQEAQLTRAEALKDRRAMIEKIDDPEKRAYALNLLENQQNQLILGLPVQDRKVVYNPTPVETFSGIVAEIGRTLYALVTGNLNPTWMSGPIGIVSMVHDQSLLGFKEALFWLGLISLNLGILNLLPIPVLDGGTIVFCLYELVTRKRIHPKTMEKLIIPFALLLIAFFIFLTYNDILRLVSRLWH